MSKVTINSMFPSKEECLSCDVIVLYNIATRKIVKIKREEYGNTFTNCKYSLMIEGEDKIVCENRKLSFPCWDGESDGFSLSFDGIRIDYVSYEQRAGFEINKFNKIYMTTNCTESNTREELVIVYPSKEEGGVRFYLQSNGYYPFILSLDINWVQLIAP